MYKVITSMMLLTGLVMGGVRMFDVAPYANCNGRVNGDQAHGVSESFINTADSLLWVDYFVGAANGSGTYQIVVQTLDGQPVFNGAATAGDSVRYEYRRASLSPVLGAPPLVKGDSYVLKVYHSAGESLNYYYDPTGPYRYGGIVSPSMPQGCDLAARIEGINRPITSKPDAVSGR